MYVAHMALVHSWSVLIIKNNKSTQLLVSNPHSIRGKLGHSFLKLALAQLMNFHGNISNHLTLLQLWLDISTNLMYSEKYAKEN